MARHELVKRQRRRPRFARYLSARQLLHRHLSAATPVRFLQKLGLLSSSFRKHGSPGVVAIQQPADFFDPYGETQSAQPAVPAVLDGDPVSQFKTSAVSSRVESGRVVPASRPMIPDKVTTQSPTVPVRPSADIVRREGAVYPRSPVAKPDLHNRPEAPESVSRRPLEHHVAEQVRESPESKRLAFSTTPESHSPELNELRLGGILEVPGKDVQATGVRPEHASSQDSQEETPQPVLPHVVVPKNTSLEEPLVIEAESSLVSSEPATIELELPLLKVEFGHDQPADQESPKSAQEHFADLSPAGSGPPESSTVTSLPEDLANVDRPESVVSASENLNLLAGKSDFTTESAQEDEPARVEAQPPVSAGPTQRRARIEEVSAPPGRPVTVKANRPGDQQAQPAPQSTAKPTATSRPDLTVEDEAVRPAELFAASGQVDRSPAAWAARLTEAFRTPAANESPPTSSGPVRPSPLGAAKQVPTLPSRVKAPPRQLPVSIDDPEALPPSAARFLKPLVGIEPSSVPLYRGSEAAKITRANRADAIAMGEAILLKPGYTSDSPELLGVVAHELTHIVRHRQPRFVPPIARDNRMPANVSAELMDEETLAQRVEARVIQAAQSVAPAAPGGPAASTEVRFSALPGSIDVTDEPTEPRSAFTDVWGGLPAPWEPLPDWVTAISESNPAPALSSGGLGAVSSGTAAGGGEGVSIQRAEEGRPVTEVPPPSAAPAPSAGPEKQAPPDLDALARQVYDVLRRRLGAEQRRELV